MQKIFISGHRNPDIDSLASAAALAELRRRQGMKNVCALCPGVMPERARRLFDRFGITPPPSRQDVRVRMNDFYGNRESLTVKAGTPLFDAVSALRSSGTARLPVINSGNQLLGMLSPLALLGELLNITGDASGSLTGRRVRSSVELIRRVLGAEGTVICEGSKIIDFDVYVAAMSLEKFEKHLKRLPGKELALIVGDRPDIQLRALSFAEPIKLLIVTGDTPVDQLILSEAKKRGMSILRTRRDSASVTRLLRFATPVELTGLETGGPGLSPADLASEVKNEVLRSPEDAFPVCNDDGTLAGVVYKSDFTSPPPFAMILVDHNEPAHGLPGVDELPILEVVDHHRIGMKPTAEPIKFTGDVVGSTCTLVAMMFRAAGESLDPSYAGLLLGGLISDTLNLQSPTTSPLDRRIAEWLEKLAGIKGGDLMAELMTGEETLLTRSIDDLLNSDRKNYEELSHRFAVAQVEETHLEFFHRRSGELREAIQKTVAAEEMDFFILMVTDAARGNSEALYCGSKSIEKRLSFDRGKDNIFLLPGVVSRKKQLLPQVLAAIGN